jgi:hypothetical protein
MIWEDDQAFVDWLDDEELGTDEEPLDDDTIDLMYLAWTAGIRHKRCRKDDRAR